MRARKRFSQNFLTDESVAHRIGGAVALGVHDRLLEVGPGRGALTQVLYANAVARYLAVEIDRDLIDWLARTYPKLELLNADILRILDQALVGGDWRVVGNLPYNISTPLLVRLFARSELIRDMHFMLQREVAQRLGASPGTKQWGRLSVVAQFHCEIETLFEVAPESFTPAPKVRSCIVRFVPRKETYELNDAKRLDLVLRHAFSGRRKRITNALKSLAIRWDELSLPAEARADQLSVLDYVAIANACDSNGDEH